MRPMMLIVAGTIGLAGCQNVVDQAPPSATAELVDPLPANFRQMIIADIKSSFFDPYSIRDAAISTPIPGTALLGPVKTICVQANAKNRLGGYTGIQETAFVFRGGVMTTKATGRAAAISCSNAAYQPFPEIIGDRAPQRG